MISYLGIFPAAWVLRHRRPDDARPYKTPLISVMTILSMLAILFCTVETIFPGLGDKWFGADYRPSADWAQNEKWTYLGIVAIPLVLFLAIAIGLLVRGQAAPRTGVAGLGRRADQAELLDRQRGHTR